SQKNTCRPRTGSLPSSANRITPISTVMTSASSGEARLQAREGWGRASSRSMGELLVVVLAVAGPVPQTRHPFADALDRGLGAGQAGRQAPLGDHIKAVADLEQLVQLLADHEHGAAGVAQGQDLAPDLRRSPHIDPPGGLADDEQAWPCLDLAPDDEFLQVAAR